MEKINFAPDGQTPVEWYVIEQTRLGGITYLLVTDQAEGDADALILKDLSSEQDAEGLYEIVEDERELAALAVIFDDLLEEIDLISENKTNK